MEEIESLKKEYDDLLKQLGSPELLSDWEKFLELSKRKNFLEKIFEKEKEIKEIEKEIKENQLILTANEDQDLVSLAGAEIGQFQDRKKLLKNEFEELLKNGSDGKKNDIKTQNDNMAAIIEIRAGTGGDEASLFAGDLYRMYSRYAQNQGWKLKTLDSDQTELGGYKEIIFEV